MSRTLVDVEEAGPASFEELRVRDCSIKRTLDVVGEKWTLLVLREAFYGARRFEQFLANVGCARTLLNDSPRSSSTACSNASPIANPASVNAINTCSPKKAMTCSRPWSY